MGRPALVCGPMIHNEGTKVQNSSAIRACGGPGDGHFTLYLFTRDEKCKLFHARMVHARSPSHAGGVRMSSEGKHGDKLETFLFQKDLNYFSSILAEKDKRAFTWIVLLLVVVYSG